MNMVYSFLKYFLLPTVKFAVFSINVSYIFY